MITIEQVGMDQAEVVFEFVDRLLRELREEQEAYDGLDTARLRRHWASGDDRFTAFTAQEENGDVVGVLTLAECFAIYAGGRYGVINELYVAEMHRSQKVGEKLVQAAREYATGKGWQRIDVTAPAGEKWRRTVRFYERLGFVFTGPKLKLRL